jgi:hypothetical protein
MKLRNQYKFNEFKVTVNGIPYKGVIGHRGDYAKLPRHPWGRFTLTLHWMGNYLLSLHILYAKLNAKSITGLVAYIIQ